VSIGLIILMFIFVGSIMIFKASDSIGARFARAPSAQEDDRHQYNTLAVMMFKEHPLLGVGLNNYCFACQEEYTPRTGLNEDGAPAHNIYFLTLAEIGPIGMGLLILYFLRYVFAGFKIIFFRHQGYFSCIATGISIGIFIFMVHNSLEWMFRFTPLIILFHILAAMMTKSVYLMKNYDVKNI